MDEQKNKTTGFLVSIGFHALVIFLLFVIPGFTNDTIFAGEGIEVALGSDVEGGNTGLMADNGASNVNPPPPQETSGDNSMDNIATDENSESKIVIPEKDKKTKSPEKKSDKKNNTTTTNSENKTQERQVDKSSTYQKKTGTTNGKDGGDPNSTGYGGNKSGNKGQEDGTPNANPDGNNPTGNSSFRAGADLKGRSVKNSPVLDNNFKYEGVLRLQITVDKAGNVTEVKVAVGTTITDLTQRNKAIQQIKTQLKFNYKADAEDDQSGYYTIYYKKH